MDLKAEIQKRRTFAIISHPDAGKTTCTEKLLLYGGAIQMAGSVKARRASRSATSDWMAIEKERGISVTSTVLQFDYNGFRINLLDTPGHQDFSEDTYRTLMAADAAIMLLDGGKGVEPITEKLYQVCRLREIPVFTFINKMDRPALEALQLLDEIHHKLGLANYPHNWPVGNGASFCGLLDRTTNKVELFARQEGGAKQALAEETALEDPRIIAKIGEEGIARIREDLALVQENTVGFDRELVLSGQLSPVFFGSAMTNFGVEQLLKGFLAMSPGPQPRDSNQGAQVPEAAPFSAFVFKTQANMDPRHRDRIAFLRIVSGKYTGNMEASNSRLDKVVRLANPKEFFGQDRDTVAEAFAGDILGIMNQGTLLIGDTLSETPGLKFPAIPSFSPEHFGILRCAPSQRKSFNKGLEQLLQEGAIQGLKDPKMAGNDFILGAVGPLQFEVLQYRLKNEYHADTTLDPMPYKLARWIQGPAEALESLAASSVVRLVEDLLHRPVALFRDPWSMESIAQKHDKLKFLPIAPQG